MILLKNIKLIVYDFDGVMTDNRVLISEDGKESVFCNRSDGLAIDKIKKMNISQIIVSTERNKIVATRGKKLRIPVFHNIENKEKWLRSYCKKYNIDLKKVVYLGNDLNDLEIMKLVGYPIAPVDAFKEIKKIAKITINKKGGEGVIRDFLDLLKLYT